MSERIVVQIEGMSCGGCANTVKKAIEGIEGVDRAEVDHKSGEADIIHAEVADIEDKISERVEKEGYTLIKQN